jgi:hypothetical protein
MPLLDDNGLVTPLKDMAYPAVSSIEALGVDTVELAHPLSKVGIRGFHQQVVVIAHQAVGVDGPVKPLYH